MHSSDGLGDQPGSDVSTNNIARVNEIVVNRKKGADSRLKMLRENGFPDDSQIVESIVLSNLDDLKSTHGDVVG